MVEMIGAEADACAFFAAAHAFNVSCVIVRDVVSKLTVEPAGIRQPHALHLPENFDVIFLISSPMRRWPR